LSRRGLEYEKSGIKLVFFVPYRNARVGEGDHSKFSAVLLRKWDLFEVYQEVVKFPHSLSKELLFPVEVALCHFVDIIANELKLVCSGESEVIPKIDEGAWDRAYPHHNINMAAIKNEVEDDFEEMARVFLSN
jgi:hypothetical protein